MTDNQRDEILMMLFNERLIEVREIVRLNPQHAKLLDSWLVCAEALLREMQTP